MERKPEFSHMGSMVRVMNLVPELALLCESFKTPRTSTSQGASPSSIGTIQRAGGRPSRALVTPSQGQKLHGSAQQLTILTEPSGKSLNLSKFTKRHIAISLSSSGNLYFKFRSALFQRQFTCLLQHWGYLEGRWQRADKSHHVQKPDALQQRTLMELRKPSTETNQ